VAGDQWSGRVIGFASKNINPKGILGHRSLATKGFMSLKIALIFPGQGAQDVGMGKGFYDQNPEARKIFDAANAVIPGLTDVIFSGPQEKLTSTAFCQPAIVTVCVAALRAFESNPKYKNVQPCYAAGLSLGEYSALIACGAIGFEDAIRLVERRSTFMEEATKLQAGAMAAVIGFDVNELTKICHEVGAQIANFNSLEQTVITGEKDKVARAGQILQEKGAKRVIPLQVGGAFHSALMQPVVEKFIPELQKAKFTNPHFPLVGDVDAKPVSDAEMIRRNLALQITSSVRWVEIVQTIAAQGVTTFIEIGPGSVLKGLVRKIDRNLTVHNIEKPEDIEDWDKG
jgi:[acyl-carrier-protein] S-malonyltransferase